jgi:hypothetical protein
VGQTKDYKIGISGLYNASKNSVFIAKKVLNRVVLTLASNHDEQKTKPYKICH